MEIQFWRDVQLVGDIFPVLFALTHALGKQIFDLSVHRAEVILCPCRDSVVQLCRQPQRDLLFSVITHDPVSVYAAGVDHRLGIAVPAKDHEKV